MKPFSITARPIDVAECAAALGDDAAGGVVTFEGRVRNRNAGRDVVALEYEVHIPTALAEGDKVLAEAVEKFDIVHVACVHREGRLAIGDCAVWIGVSAAHRGAAFDACRYIINEIKHRLPIWKKEHYADGDSGWVACDHPQVGT